MTALLRRMGFAYSFVSVLVMLYNRRQVYLRSVPGRGQAAEKQASFCAERQGRWAFGNHAQADGDHTGPPQKRLDRLSPLYAKRGDRVTQF